MKDYKAIVEKQEEYIELLIEEINSLTGYAPWWRSKRVKEGEKLRSELAALNEQEVSTETIPSITDEMIRNKALEIVGFDKTNPKTFTQEMAVNHILIFAKWMRNELNYN